MGRRRRGGIGDIINLLILNSIFNSPSPKRGRRRNNPTQPANGEDSVLVQILSFLCVVMAFIGGIKAALITLIGIIVFLSIWFIFQSSNKSIGEQATQVFTPTDELAALLRRQKLRDRLKYLGCFDGQELLEKYPMCLTDVEKQDIVDILQKCRDFEQQGSGQQVPYEYDDEENRPVINWSKQKPIEYDDDDTYDNFYMQHEDEFKEMWGKDDYEDAIEEAWEEHQREKEQKKRWGR